MTFLGEIGSPFCGPSVLLLLSWFFLVKGVCFPPARMEFSSGVQLKSEWSHQSILHSLDYEYNLKVERILHSWKIKDLVWSIYCNLVLLLQSKIELWILHSWRIEDLVPSIYCNLRLKFEFCTIERCKILVLQMKKKLTNCTSFNLAIISISALRLWEIRRLRASSSNPNSLQVWRIVKSPETNRYSGIVFHGKKKILMQ
jgi:hypothetical protein